MECENQQRGMESGKSSSEGDVRRPHPMENGSEETSRETSSSFSSPVESKVDVSSGSEEELRVFSQQLLSAGPRRRYPYPVVYPVFPEGWIMEEILKEPMEGSFGEDTKVKTGHQKQNFLPQSVLGRHRGGNGDSPTEPPVEFLFKEKVLNGGAQTLEYSSVLDCDPSSNASWMPEFGDFGDLLPEKRGMRVDSSSSSGGDRKFQPRLVPSRPKAPLLPEYGPGGSWRHPKRMPAFPGELDFPGDQDCGTPEQPCTLCKGFMLPGKKWSGGEQYTRIHLFADRRISFNDRNVSFVIQVVNFPSDFRLHPTLLSAVAYSPSGTEIKCRVRSHDSFIVNAFQGIFKADGEVGNYNVVVNLEVPRDKMEEFNIISETADSVVCGSTEILVCRNYLMESERDSLRIKCDFVPSAMGWKPSGLELDGSADVDQNWRKRQPTVNKAGIPSKLWGLTCDMRSNNLYYTDRDSHKITCVTPHGQTVLKFGEHARGPETHRINRPTGIAFDEAHRRLVLCDKDNHRICFFTTDGEFISSFGAPGHKDGLFNYPWDVAVSPNGSIAVTDSKNKRVQFFDQCGNYTGKYTVFEVCPFDYKNHLDLPRGVCFDNDGSSVYITDFNVNNVLEIPTSLFGHRKLLPYGALLRPQGITMDSCGHLLVVDSRHDCLRQMNTQGEHIATIRKINREPISFPVNLTMMAGGFVAMLSGSGNIRIF